MGLGEGVATFLQKIGAHPATPLGEIWEGEKAAKAFQDGSLRSSGAGNRVRVAFRNLSTIPVLLCWISEKGELHHFYKLPPSSLGGDSPSSFLSNSDPLIVEGDHIETTCGGHAFCIADVGDDPEELKKVQKQKKLPEAISHSCIVGGYRPLSNCRAESVQLVTIAQGGSTQDDDDGDQCCGPNVVGARRFLRKRKISQTKTSDNDNADTAAASRGPWNLSARIAKVDPTPWDTTQKVYELQMMGGWPVYAEPDWHKGNIEVQKRLERDLEEVGRLLPKHASDYLRKNCPIYVNSSLKFGPRACPITAKACCYHPDKDWLIENGLSERKHKCVEINDGPGYADDLDFWGLGGLMLHELSHAYHHRMLKDGYNNKEIKACYRAAMKDGLYNCVRVHGPQGPEAKAYACTNAMEYFAELSAAFLGGLDDKKEFNKWYPFNRKQLKEHDPRAYRLLARLWRVDP